jgi:tetratricopeptide (TPR) repeat protein
VIAASLVLLALLAGTTLSMNNLASSDNSVGRLDDALKLPEKTLALKKAKLGPDHPDTLMSMNNLAFSDLASSRPGEALALLETASGKDTDCFLTLAAFQAWFGDAEAYAAVRRRFLEFARETKDILTARRATLAASLRPSADPAELESLLALGRKARELGKGEWELLALGMAEFRNGHFDEADEALLAVPKAGQNADPQRIAAFYRAMRLFHQGKKDEARDLATKAAAEMKPLPQDERKPVMPDGSGDLILWLAYKEAKALIGFDAPSAASTPLEKK